MSSVAAAPPTVELQQRRSESLARLAPRELPSERKSAEFNGSRDSRWGVGLLLGLLILQVPLFLARPLGPDTELYDLQARTVLDGGVLYRDILEPNLPGVVVVHLLVRSVAGWSEVALRGFDLLVVAGVVWLLCRWSKDSDSAIRRRSNPWLALALFGFYFALGECDQCQRDLWALLPALGALTLHRQRRFSGSQDCRITRTAGWSALTEGALWAVACWIKPHVIVPGVLGFVVSSSARRFRRAAFADAAVVLLGGAVLSSGVITWLAATGAWPHLLETLTVWNPEYLHHGRANWSAVRVGSIFESLLPWSAAVPLAIVLTGLAVCRRFSRGTMAHDSGDHESTRTDSRLLAAFFVGWAAQALLLQNAFAYVQVPLVFLGVTVCWRDLAQSGVLPRERRALALAAATLVVLLDPHLATFTPTDWWVAVTRGSSPELQARLQVDPLPVRSDLEAVARHLSTRGLRDGDLTVYSANAVSLFRRLDCQPSTRFVFTDIHARIFIARRQEIVAALGESRQRYAVVCLLESGVPPAEVAAGAGDDLTSLDNWLSDTSRQKFPFNQSPVFRSGSYVVYEVDQPVGDLFIRDRRSAAHRPSASHPAPATPRATARVQP
jgi:hypothetical protein